MASVQDDEARTQGRRDGSSRRCVVRGWLEPDGPDWPHHLDEPIPGFSAAGQVAPFGVLRLVCTSSGGTRTAVGWATVIAEGGDSLYGALRSERLELVVDVDGGTGRLDGATGWIRIEPPAGGAGSAGVTGELWFPPGATTVPPPADHRHLGTYERSGREPAAGGAGP